MLSFRISVQVYDVNSNEGQTKQVPESGLSCILVDGCNYKQVWAPLFCLSRLLAHMYELMQWQPQLYRSNAAHNSLSISASVLAHSSGLPTVNFICPMDQWSLLLIFTKHPATLVLFGLAH